MNPEAETPVAEKCAEATAPARKTAGEEDAPLIAQMKPDAGRVWAQVEERLAPMLRMDAFERAVYYYLLQEGVLRGARRPVRVTHKLLQDLTGYKGFGAWRRLQGLCRKGCARIRRGDLQSSWVEVNTPEEILERLEDSERTPAGRGGKESPARDPCIRNAIYKREGGRCFYCLQFVKRENITLDHVVPVSGGGEDTLRNLVACCYECNFTKWTQAAPDFLRGLYRRNVITKTELQSGVKRLKDLAQGKLKLRCVGRPGRKHTKKTVAGGESGAWMNARMV